MAEVQETKPPVFDSVTGEKTRHARSTSSSGMEEKDAKKCLKSSALGIILGDFFNVDAYDLQKCRLLMHPVTARDAKVRLNSRLNVNNVFRFQNCKRGFVCSLSPSTRTLCFHQCLFIYLLETHRSSINALHRVNFANDRSK